MALVRPEMKCPAWLPLYGVGLPQEMHTPSSSVPDVLRQSRVRMNALKADHALSLAIFNGVRFATFLLQRNDNKCSAEFTAFPVYLIPYAVSSTPLSGIAYVVFDNLCSWFIHIASLKWKPPRDEMAFVCVKDVCVRWSFFEGVCVRYNPSSYRCTLIIP